MNLRIRITFRASIQKNRNAFIKRCASYWLKSNWTSLYIFIIRKLTIWRVHIIQNSIIIQIITWIWVLLSHYHFSWTRLVAIKLVSVPTKTDNHIADPCYSCMPYKFSDVLNLLVNDVEIERVPFGAQEALSQFHPLIG